MMKTTTWPILLGRECARRHEKIKRGLDNRHRKSVLSNVEGFKSLNITESVPAVPLACPEPCRRVPAVPVGEIVPLVPDDSLNIGSKRSRRFKRFSSSRENQNHFEVSASVSEAASGRISMLPGAVTDFRKTAMSYLRA
jgi:hypothetical protein